MNRQRLRGVGLLLLGAVAVLVLRLLVDRDPLSGDISLAWPEAAWRPLRLHAALAGAALGGALALSGTLLQASLRNVLAAPSLLGVASGAGLGVMVVLYVAHVSGMHASSGMWTLGAFIGAMGALLLVLQLGRRDGWPDPVTTILAGVIVATMASAGMVLLQGLVPEGLRGRFLAWAMGTVPELPEPGLLWSTVALLGVVGVVAFLGASRLDALLLSEDTAITIGAQPERVRTLCLLAAGLLTACAVALAGPLAFVGLVAPHMARRLLGSAHRLLVPGSVLAGIVLVVGADALRQVLDLGAGRLPVGVLTTLIGGPAFLVLLRRAMRGSHAAL